jgi:hypothetical protein
VSSAPCTCLSRTTRELCSSQVLRSLTGRRHGRLDSDVWSSRRDWLAGCVGCYAAPRVGDRKLGAGEWWAYDPRRSAGCLAHPLCHHRLHDRGHLGRSVAATTVVAATRPFHLPIWTSGRAYSPCACSRFWSSSCDFTLLCFCYWSLIQGTSTTRMRRGRLELATAWH